MTAQEDVVFIFEDKRFEAGVDGVKSVTRIEPTFLSVGGIKIIYDDGLVKLFGMRRLQR